MKNLFLITFLSLLAFSCKPDKDAFVIQGKIKGLNEKYIYLVHPQESGHPLDTLEVKDGTFRIKGKITNPNVYLLAFGEKYMPIEIYLEPGKFEVEGDLNDINSIVVKGGTLQSTYNEFVKDLTPLNDAYTQIYAQLEAAKKDSNELIADSLNYELDSIKDNYYEKSYQFVENHPVSILSAKLISEILMTYPNIERLDPIIEQFDENVKKSSYGQRIQNTMQVLKKTKVGMSAPEFNLQDMEGNEVSIAQYKGKYVLVDFWASWCRPCREENPRIVKIYNQHKGAKFDILSVSIDDNKEAWKGAVLKDQLKWTQVIDDKDVANPIYGVISIPANVLIDPDGIIVAKNIFGRKLENQLNEVLN